MEYQTIAQFVEAVKSGEIDASKVRLFLDATLFYIMDENLENELISGEWEDVYVWFISEMSKLGITKEE